MSDFPSAPEVPPTSRLSLLDVFIEEFQQESANRCSRLLLTGALDPSHSFSSLNDFHTSFISHRSSLAGKIFPAPAEEQENSTEGEKITGVLFHINSSAFAIFLEASTTTIIAYLKLLVEAENSQGLKDDEEKKKKNNPSESPASSSSPSCIGAPIASQCRILSFSEEIPREYPFFLSRALRISPDEEFFPPKELLAFTFETLKNFIELARDMISSSSNEEKQLDFLQSSQSKQFYQRIPTVERIFGYLKCEELFEPSAFLDCFDQPVDLLLESERVWPVEGLAVQQAALQQTNK